MSARPPRPVSSWRNRVTELRYVAPRELADHPLQWRQHPDPQRFALRGLLEEVGIAGALLAYDSPTTGLTSIDGHLRKSLDADVAWPTLILDVTDAEAALLLATHDPLAAMAAADQTQLSALLHTVQSGDAAVQAMLSALAQREGVVPPEGTDTGAAVADVEPQIDRAEELRAQWGVEVGDLWQCGEHRVVCGDCTDQAVVARVIEGKQVVLLSVDPPYGTGGWRRAMPGAGRSPKAIYVKEAWDEWPDSTLRAISALVDRVACFAMNLESAFATFQAFKTRRLRYWKKSDPRPTFEGRIVESVEPILVASHDGSALHGHGENWFEASTPRHNRDKDGTGHPYQKPLALLTWLLTDLSEPGDTIIDPFLGSGTTLIACEHLQRRCYGCEIDPGYVAVTLERWADLTGQTPQRLD